MSYLVDTDYVIDYLRGNAAAVQLLDGLVVSGIAISIVTYGEVYEGILFGRERQRDEPGFRSFLRVADLLSLNRSIMTRFAQMRGTLRQRGERLADFDLLIA